MSEFEEFSRELAGDGTPAGHLSPSQVAQYLRCPAQYWYAHVMKIKAPPSGAQVSGRAVHAGIEHNYRQKRETRQDLPEQEVVEVAVTAFEQAAQDAIFTEEEKPAALKDQTAALAGLYHREVAPQVQPVMVEERVTISVPGAQVVGIVDVADEAGTIRDTKTAAPQSLSNLTHNLADNVQLNTYAAAYRALAGKPPAAVQLDILVRGKEPKVVQHRAMLTEDDEMRWARLMARVADAIRKGAFYPNRNWWGCSPKWCAFFDRCRREW